MTTIKLDPSKQDFIPQIPLSMTIFVITSTLNQQSKCESKRTWSWPRTLTMNLLRAHQLLRPIPSNWPRIGLNINLTDRKNTKRARERERERGEQMALAFHKINDGASFVGEVARWEPGELTSRWQVEWLTTPITQRLIVPGSCLECGRICGSF